MCIWQKHRRCHFHQRCGHSLDANFVKGQPSESRTKLLEYMGWSAQWRWWQINKQPLLLLINDQCWPFTQWWPCHRTQTKVLISVMLTKGVDQCYVNPRCWAWQTSCDDSTSATEPPSLPSKIIKIFKIIFQGLYRELCHCEPWSPWSFCPRNRY